MMAPLERALQLVRARKLASAGPARPPRRRTRYARASRPRSRTRVPSAHVPSAPRRRWPPSARSAGKRQCGWHRRGRGWCSAWWRSRRPSWTRLPHTRGTCALWQGPSGSSTRRAPRWWGRSSRATCGSSPLRRTNTSRPWERSLPPRERRRARRTRAWRPRATSTRACLTPLPRSVRARARSNARRRKGQAPLRGWRPRSTGTAEMRVFSRVSASALPSAPVGSLRVSASAHARAPPVAHGRAHTDSARARAGRDDAALLRARRDNMTGVPSLLHAGPPRSPAPRCPAQTWRLALGRAGPAHALCHTALQRPSCATNDSRARTPTQTPNPAHVVVRGSNITTRIVRGEDWPGPRRARGSSTVSARPLSLLPLSLSISSTRCGRSRPPRCRGSWPTFP